MRSENALVDLLRASADKAKATIQRLPREVHLLGDVMALHRWAVGDGPSPPTSAREQVVRDLCIYATFAYGVAAKAAVECQSFSLPALERLAIDCLLRAAAIATSRDAEKAWRDRHSEFSARLKAGGSVNYEDFLRLDARGRGGTRKHFERSKLESSLRAVLGEKPDVPGVATSLMQYYKFTIDFGAHPNLLFTVVNAEATPVSGDRSRRAIVHRMLHEDVAQARSECVALVRLGLLHGPSSGRLAAVRGRRAIGAVATTGPGDALARSHRPRRRGRTPGRVTGVAAACG